MDHKVAFKSVNWGCRLRLKCDGTRAETRFRLSAKRTSTFKSAGASVQSTTVNRGVLISGGNAGYTMFRGSVKRTGYPLHSPASPSLPLPSVTVCHRISTGLYLHSVLSAVCLMMLPVNSTYTAWKGRMATYCGYVFMLTDWGKRE